MFVISLVRNGDLKKTAVRSNAIDAAEIAIEWYRHYHNRQSEKGHIYIDQEVKGEISNARFAVISFHQKPEDVKAYLSNKTSGDEWKHKYAHVTKAFMVSFLEYALVRLTEFIKEKNQKG